MEIIFLFGFCIPGGLWIQRMLLLSTQDGYIISSVHVSQEDTETVLMDTLFLQIGYILILSAVSQAAD